MIDVAFGIGFKVYKYHKEQTGRSKQLLPQVNVGSQTDEDTDSGTMNASYSGFVHSMLCKLTATDIQTLAS
jgi:hypothetical protein